MDKKKIASILLIIFLILSWVVNLSYFYARQLREPVFLKQYISGRFYPKQNLEFDFYYIKINSSRKHIFPFGLKRENV